RGFSSRTRRRACGKRIVGSRLRSMACAALLVACSDGGRPAISTDAGFGDSAVDAVDSGNTDTGPRDTGPDTGPGDSGPDTGPGGPGDSGPGDSGPGDSGVDGFPARLFDSFLEFSTASCECTFATQGYESVAQCANVGAFSPSTRPCIAEALAEIDAVDRLECYVETQLDLSRCLQSAGCGSSPARMACEDAFARGIRTCGSSPSAEEVLFDFRSRVGACAVGPASSCPDGDPSSAVGDDVFRGTTVGASNGFERGCTNRTPDRAHVWTAPAAGRYTIDTVGSDYDTNLAVYGDCDAADAIVCNDDGVARTSYSSVTVDVTAGSSILIVVEGFFLAAGNYTVNIQRAP
ncbi:MAG: hypothetical protein AAGE52_29535, partial [Myxococcota bacterium]